MRIREEEKEVKLRGDVKAEERRGLREGRLGDREVSMLFNRAVYRGISDARREGREADLAHPDHSAMHTNFRKKRRRRRR